MAELADAPDLGSGGNPVQVQVLLPASGEKSLRSMTFRFFLFDHYGYGEEEGEFDMRIKNRKRLVNLIMLLVLSLCLGSCGGCAGCGKQEDETGQVSLAEEASVPQSSEPTAEPVATPEPTAEPTATPEPLPDFVDLDSPTLAVIQAALDNEQYVTVNVSGETLFGEGEEGMEKLKEAMTAEQTESEIKVDVKGKYGESAAEETLTIPAGKTLNLNGKTSVGAKGLIVVQGTANNAGGLFLGTQMQMEEGGVFVNAGLLVRPEHKHKAVKDAAVAATCTKDGLTKGSHCSVCGEILEEQKVVPATGHKEVKDAAVAAGCETEGLTEGSHCSKCGEVFVKQEKTPATGHAAQAFAEVASSCVTAGRAGGTKCATCGKILSGGEALPLAGHTLKDVPEEPASCTHGGTSAGKICTTCNQKIEGFVAIGPTPHQFRDIPAKKATCTADGNEAGRECTVCGYKEGGAVIPGGHDWRYVEAHGDVAAYRYCNTCLRIEPQ